MEREILGASLASREAKDQINSLIDINVDLSSIGKIIYLAIQAYYDRDNSTKSVSKDTLISQLRTTAKYSLNIDLIIDAVESLEVVSPPNVIECLTQLKIKGAANEAAKYLSLGQYTQADTWVAQYELYRSKGIVGSSSGIEVINDKDISELLQKEGGDFDLWPSKLNDILKGRTKRQHHIGIFARPECVGRLSKLQVIRGQKAYDANRSSRTYTIEQLYRLFYKQEYPTWIKSMNITTKEVSYKKIKDIWFSGRKPVLKLSTNAATITLTSDHLIWTEGGWRKTGDLLIGERVASHRSYTYTHDKALSKTKNKELCTKLPYSPYKTRTIGGQIYNRVPEHRLMYDAYLNEQTREGFIEHLKTSPNHNFTFSDSTKDIHHVDGDRTNNAKDNLILLSRENHSRQHANSSHFGQNGIVYEELVRVDYLGAQDCYDIEMEDSSNPTFIANDIVVHNCGKSLFCINLAAGLCHSGNRVVYVGNEDPEADMIARFISRLSNTNIDEVFRDSKSALSKARENGYSNLHFVPLSGGNFTILKRLVEDIEPDVLIVDQVRNLNLGFDGLTATLEAASKGMREIAKEYNLLACSVTQAGESARNSLVLDDGDIDSSNTGFSSQLDLLIGIGVNDEFLRTERRMISLKGKNKISGDHSYFPCKIDPLKSKVTSL